MKYIILKLFVIIVLNVQAQTELVLIKSEDGFQRLLLKKSERDISIDTIVGFAYFVELLDYKILSQTEVSSIIKSRVGYEYLKWEKLNGTWEDQPQCGFIAANPIRFSFAPKDLKIPIDSTFKIFNNDRVEYRYNILRSSDVQNRSQNSWLATVDCKKNEQRNNAWEKRCLDFLKKNKSSNNEK